MAKEKLTTAEILAQARRQDSGQSSESSAGAPDADSSGPTAQEASSSVAKTPKPKTPAATPGSTVDILAAARSQGSAGAAAKPAAPVRSSASSPAKPSAKKAAAKPVAVGDRPPVEEMVRRLHEGRLHEGRLPVGKAQGGKAQDESKPARPKLPSRPPLPKRRPEQAIPRRAVPGAMVASVFAVAITPFAMAWVLLGLIGGVWTLLTARFMMPNMIVELPSRFKVGPPNDVPPGAVSEKFKASRGVWLVHSDAYNGEDIVYALASVCTHLGCTPNWLEGEQKFKCPCHGSGFYITGINFEGPAPRPLERVGLSLAEDGMLEVDKSVKFQEELGQWQDANSFVPLG